MGVTETTEKTEKVSSRLALHQSARARGREHANANTSAVAAAGSSRHADDLTCFVLSHRLSEGDGLMACMPVPPTDERRGRNVSESHP